MDIQILKVLCGSRAHGLHRPDSDYDYRAVYVIPTSEMLSLDFKPRNTNWIEGKEDNTSYEIGHFLFLATKSNPSILEVFVAPIPDFDSRSVYEKSLAIELRNLFPYVWNPKNAYDAFVGYGINQRKKMLENHLDRWQKYAVAYVRTLYNLIDLLQTSTFKLEVSDPRRKQRCEDIREGKISIGEIIDITNELERMAKIYLPLAKNTQDLNKVNNFLLTVRKTFWS